jgi:DNA-binding response OmpR family regulator
MEFMARVAALLRRRHAHSNEHVHVHVGNIEIDLQGRRIRLGRPIYFLP